VYVIFKGLYQKKIYPYRSLVLIMIGLCLGLLFFPSTDFSKSILVGGIFNKSIFNEIFTNSLLFWSFLFATFSPMIFDFIYRKAK
ncbi:MAG: sodium:solute symporter, partial [Proteobacteria bacterium]|nr:sodium:solute symporter [Candidatus Fonsibacter lacus]